MSIGCLRAGHTQQPHCDGKSMLEVSEELPARAKCLRVFIHMGYGMIGILLGRK